MTKVTASIFTRGHHRVGIRGWVELSAVGSDSRRSCLAVSIEARTGPGAIDNNSGFVR